MNFTWFASAYDADDLPYRLLTFVQIIGVLILAAGVPAAFRPRRLHRHHHRLRRDAGGPGDPVAAGRAGDPSGRSAARRYAAAIAVVQIGWVARLFLPHVAGDDRVPRPGAGRDAGARPGRSMAARGTAWHPRAHQRALRPLHPDRAGRMRGGGHRGHAVGDLARGSRPRRSAWPPAGCSSSSRSGGGTSSIRPRRPCGCHGISAFLWGYAHYAVFASVAALGAGLEVALESTRRGSEVSPTTAGVTIAICLAVYLVITGAVQVRLNPTGVLKTRFVIPFAVMILIVGWNARALSIGLTLPIMGLIVLGLVLLDGWPRLSIELTNARVPPSPKLPKCLLIPPDLLVAPLRRGSGSTTGGGSGGGKGRSGAPKGRTSGAAPRRSAGTRRAEEEDPKEGCPAGTAAQVRGSTSTRSTVPRSTKRRTTGPQRSGRPARPGAPSARPSRPSERVVQPGLRRLVRAPPPDRRPGPPRPVQDQFWSAIGPACVSSFERFWATVGLVPVGHRAPVLERPAIKCPALERPFRRVLRSVDGDPRQLATRAAAPRGTVRPAAVGLPATARAPHGPREPGRPSRAPTTTSRCPVRPRSGGTSPAAAHVR